MHLDSLKTMSGSYSGLDLSIHIEKYKIYLVTQFLQIRIRIWAGIKTLLIRNTANNTKLYIFCNLCWEFGSA